MRKRIITPALKAKPSPYLDLDWLNLEELAEVEITSEDTGHPIESALLPEQTTHWQASEPGKQTIRLIFTDPQHLQRIWLNFVETNSERTQEYTLRWSPDNGQTFQEIVRQQWNFSPSGSSSETEDHHVNLAAVTILELSIIPDINGGNACATLEQLRLA